MQATQPIQAVQPGITTQAAASTPADNAGKGDAFFQALSAQLDVGIAMAARLTAVVAKPVGTGSATQPDQSAGDGSAAGATVVTDASQLAALIGIGMFLPGSNPNPVQQPAAGDASATASLPVANGLAADLPTAAAGRTGQPLVGAGQPDTQKAANLAVSGQSLPTTGLGGNVPINSSARPEVLAAGADGKSLDGLLADKVPGKDAQSAPVNGSNDANRDLMMQRALEQMPRSGEPALHAAVEAPLRSAAFATEFGDRLVWMSTQQTQVADISINPPQLGAIEVRLSMNGNEAGAQFYSPNPEVRQAIDQALPRLREVMAEAGIMLGQAQVSDQSFSRQDPAPRQHSASGGREAGAALGQPAPVSTRLRVGLGLVDLYA